MTINEVVPRLTNIFRELFGSPNLTLRPDMTARDVEGWNSIQMINIVVAVEQGFGVKLKSREIDGLRSVGDLLDLVVAKTS